MWETATWSGTVKSVVTIAENSPGHRVGKTEETSIYHVDKLPADARSIKGGEGQVGDSVMLFSGRVTLDMTGSGDWQTWDEGYDRPSSTTWEQKGSGETSSFNIHPFASPEL